MHMEGFHKIGQFKPVWSLEYAVDPFTPFNPLKSVVVG